MADLSPRARERARRTVLVADVFGGYADEIARAVAEVPAGHVVVAVVDEERAFAGTHHVSTEDLVDRVSALEGTGWAMVFSPGADAEQIRGRAAEMAAIAQQRITAIDRIVARRRAD